MIVLEYLTPTEVEKKNKGGRPTKHMERYKNVGRKSKMTDEVIRKLEEAFSFDCTIQEACFFAGIGSTTFYEWREKYPEKAQRLIELKNRPVLKARATIVNGLADPEHAKWYLERKRKKEFSKLNNLDLTSAGEKLEFKIVVDDTTNNNEANTKAGGSVEESQGQDND